MIFRSFKVIIDFLQRAQLCVEQVVDLAVYVVKLQIQIALHLLKRLLDPMIEHVGFRLSFAAFL